jgi:transposase-like protein
VSLGKAARPRSYLPEFRRVFALLEAGRTVAEVTADLQISEQTVYNWRTQHLIDTGQRPGVTASDNAELIAARLGRPLTPNRLTAQSGAGRPGASAANACSTRGYSA